MSANETICLVLSQIKYKYATSIHIRLQKTKKEYTYVYFL